MKIFKAYTLVFAAGALAYSLIEIIWRGHTHISMTLAGGLCLSMLFFIDGVMKGARLWQKCILGSILITLVEFCVGCVVNRWLGLGVWDYSERFLNLLGQVCPIFSLLWFFICIPAFGICAMMKKVLEREE